MLRSTIQLLRFPFSFFLMPVFWFALAFTENIHTTDAIEVFIILHLLVYPSSNGYNSYMDRDTGSIGGVKNPLPPTRQLYTATVLMDAAAVIWSAFISWYFMAGVVIYILASKAYSYRGIRLKKNAIAAYLTVIIFQGAWVFALASHGASEEKDLWLRAEELIAAGLLVGGFYPLTQIYQHGPDKKDGVTSMSYLLGYRGTFIFSGMVFTGALLSIAAVLQKEDSINSFILFSMFFVPVLFYFTWWAQKVFRNASFADYRNTMRMNIIASVCTNAAFIYLFINRH